MEIIGQTSKPKQAQGFRRGLLQVRMGDFKQVRGELMEALGVRNRTSLAEYASGRRELRVSQAAAVESLFNRYGVTNIWGE